MGKAGPKPKSDAEKARRGNPGKRKISPESDTQGIVDEVAVRRQKNERIAVPVRPKWLKLTGKTRRAAQIWDDLVPRLMDCKLITSFESLLVAEYCMLTAELEDIYEKLAEAGFKKEVGNGGEYQKSSLVKIRDDVSKSQLKLAEQLGLTPKGRKQQGIVITVSQPVSTVSDTTSRETNSKPERGAARFKGFVVPPDEPT